MAIRSSARIGLFFVLFIAMIILGAAILYSVSHVLTPVQIFAFGLGAVLIISTGIYFMFHRVLIEVERTEANLWYQSHFDPITELPNRIQIFEFLSNLLDKKNEALHPFAILTIGIDRFPQINHALGHRIGDRLLHHVAKRLKEHFSHAQILARLSSNVFIVVLPEVTPYNYHKEAERILTLFDATFSVYTVSIDLDVLLGFSFYPNDGTEVDTLVQKSDVALYAARNASERYASYDEDKDPHHYNKISLMSELREGLNHDEFELYYQPKIDIANKHTKQVEALIRWQHHTKGFILPDQFIPLAEETGHIKKLTLWVIKEAFKQCKAWDISGTPLRVSINLSVNDLLNKDLPHYVDACLKETELDPQHITFEITESAFMHDPENALNAVHRLKKLKVHFSLDDYGSGFSSLKYLKQLPIDELKIDRSFIQDMTRSDRVAQIVRSTIELGQSLNMSVVAEGIEDESTFEALRDFQCNVGQGFFFSKPLPKATLSQWLIDSEWGFPKS